ncbi:MAG: hypothetical protein ACLGQX_00515 [Acidobacteriota bacterium]
MSLASSQFRPHTAPAQGPEPGPSQALPEAMRTAAARGVVVNRTHRVVREQAMNLREQRRRFRSLWAPLAIFSPLMITSCYAIWRMLDGYEATPNGCPGASGQLMVLLLWSLPVTAAILGLAWFRRGRNHSSGDSAGNDREVQP